MRAAAIQLNSPLHAARIAASQARVAGMRRAVGASAFARPAAFSAAESRAGASGPRFYAASHSPPSAAGEGRHGQRDGSDILWLVGSLAIFFPFLYYLTEPTPKKVSGERTRGSSSRFKNEQAKKAAEPATTEAEVSPSADASAEAEAPVENPVEENGVADETDSSAVEVEADASFSETPVDEVAEQPASVTGTESESEPKPVDVEDASEGAAPAETSNEETSFPYVIVGGGTAAFSAEEAIHELQPSAEVLVVGTEESGPYMRPPLSKELWAVSEDAVEKMTFTTWDGKPRSIYYSGAEKWARVERPGDAGSSRTKFVFGTVEQIDVASKTIKLASGQTVRYGKLLIATGGTPKSLERSPVTDNVTTFRTAADFRRLRGNVTKASPKDVVIVGGGFLGSELTMSLTKHAGSVTQIFPEEGNLARLLPKYLSQWVTDALQGAGAKVLSGHEVKRIRDVDGRLAVEVAPAGVTDEPGVLVAADEVILCLGIEPNVSVGRDAGLEVDGQRGGIRVDAELKTSAPDVFAAGDVASYTDMILGQTRSEHHDSAVMMGRVAGQNMVGVRRTYIYQPFFWTDLGENVGIEGCGRLDPNLATVGVWAKESQGSKHRKGAVFYLSDDKQIVGIALVNMYGKASAAREIIRRKRKVQNVEDLAGVFNLGAMPGSD